MQPDKFDQQIREVLTKQHFAYDPAAWEQAAAMLDQEQRKKRLFWWIWPSLVLLLLSVIAAVRFGQPQAPATAENSNASAMTQPGTVQLNTAALADTTLDHETPNDPKNSPNQSLKADDQQPTLSFYGTKKALTTQPSTNPSAALPTIDSAQEANYWNNSKMQAKVIKKLHRMLYEGNVQFKETVALPASQNAPVRPSSRSIAAGFHGFAGTGLQRTETNQVFNYGGGIFLEVRRNKLYFAIEPAVHHLTGVGGSSSRNDTSYAFGQIIKTQTLQWNNLLLAQLPLVIGFEIHPKHTFGAGLVAQQYLQSNYTLSTTTFNQGQAPSATSVIQGNARINPLFVPRFAGFLRYQYQLSSAFSLGLQYHLANPSATSVVPAQLQFQLKYHLFNSSRQ